MTLRNYLLVIAYMTYLLVDIYPFSSELDQSFQDPFSNDCNFVRSRKLYQYLRTKIESIKTICGELCDTNTSKYKPIRNGDSFHYIPLKKEINCKNIWNDSLDAVSSFKEPLQKLPKYLTKYFSHNRMVDLTYAYYDEKNYPTLFWNESFVEWRRRIFRSFFIYFHDD